jgi:hypothetical protein
LVEEYQSKKYNMIAPKATTAPKTNWATQKAKLKAKFPKITDADLDFDETRKNEMLTKLQLKTGRTASELHRVLETL